MVLKLLVELVQLVVVNLEPQESNTQVVTPAQLQQVRKIVKAAVAVAVGTAVAEVATTQAVVAAQVTSHFSQVVPQLLGAEQRQDLLHLLIPQLQSLRVERLSQRR